VATVTLRIPDGARRVLRRLTAEQVCCSCGQNVLKSLHGVTFLCNCGKAVAMCRDCFSWWLDAAEVAEGCH